LTASLQNFYSLAEHGKHETFYCREMIVTEERAKKPAARIALMLPRFSRYGGVEQYGYALAEVLVKRGHAVDFLCARQEAEAPSGVHVIAVGRPFGPKAGKLLWFIARVEMLRRKGNYDLSVSLGKTWNQDVVRVGGGPLPDFWERSERAVAPGLPRRLKRLLRCLSPANRLTLLAERRQFSPGRRVVAVSHMVRDDILRRHKGMPAEHVEVIYNRPDLERFLVPSAERRERCRRDLAGRFSIVLSEQAEAAEREAPVFVGTASTNFLLKGLGPLIEALSLLPVLPHLFVAGGRHAASYATEADRLGLAGHVHFCGKVDDMPSFYNALDIFVLPTFYDACSNAVLEALASGCRVLTSSANGAAFFLNPASILADPGDAAVMAGQMISILQGAPPPPFVWPKDIASGVEAFAERIDAMIAARRHFFHV
jgi:UDP-glucose:(heptosyl)LPS alpha-1,3-glucosyltransferase